MTTKRRARTATADPMQLLRRYARSVDRLLDAADEVRRERDKMLLEAVAARRQRDRTEGPDHAK